MGECPDRLKPFQFKPGQSGNPKGRPKRISFEAQVAKILDEKIPGLDYDKAEATARVFVDMMLSRSESMMREFLARKWPAVQKHEIELPAIGPGALAAALDRWFVNGEQEEIPGKPNGGGEA